MFPTLISQANTMTFEQVIARLSSREVVDGLILVGSARENSLTVASDYDLIVVLTDMPVPLHVILTYIDQRLTDVIVFTVPEVEHILALESPVGEESDVGRLIRWLQTGQIVFDRTGRLERAQHKVQLGNWLQPITESECYRYCLKVDFNVKHNKIMLQSDDPVYLLALDFRMLYGLAEVLFGYFRTRHLPWQGEKAAIRYWQAHDPAYLDLFQRCVTEADRARKVALYEALAVRAMAPLGGLPGEGQTTVQFRPGTELYPARAEEALNFWEALIGGENARRRVKGGPYES